MPENDLYPVDGGGNGGDGGGSGDDDLKENWRWAVNWINTSSALSWDFTQQKMNQDTHQWCDLVNTVMNP